MGHRRYGHQAMEPAQCAADIQSMRIFGQMSLAGRSSAIGQSGHPGEPVAAELLVMVGFYKHEQSY